jgi:hypothetical protein
VEPAPLADPALRLVPPSVADPVMRLIEPDPLSDPDLRLIEPMPHIDPSLRLVEPAPMADPVLPGDRRDDSLGSDLRFDPPPLRLIESELDARRSPRSAAPPVSDESDGDLLIFAACRSAWFTDPEATETSNEVDWGTADLGWRAAEQAARPAVGAETGAGLPKRVPQQNLVPGSAVTAAPERPLRIVRDAAAIAAHTSGYFRGYRRGQEVGGYAVGGRPGRESAGGWDFSRDRELTPENETENEYEYRSARR